MGCVNVSFVKSGYWIQNFKWEKTHTHTHTNTHYTYSQDGVLVRLIFYYEMKVG